MRTAEIAVALLPFLFAAPQPAPMAEDADVDHAVYAAVFENLDRRISDTNNTYLIANTTGELYTAMDPAKCVRVDPRLRGGFREILAEYAAHRQERRRIHFRLNAGKLYVLLNETETNEIERHLERLQKQHGSRHLIQLSNVYLNRNRTLAMVVVSAYCGRLCGTMSMRFYEKSGDGTWGPVRPEEPLCPITAS